MEIYRLTPADVALVRELNGLFAVAFDDPQTYAAEPPADAYFRDLLGKDHITVLVAITEGRVVGGLVAYDLDKFERPRRETYIYDLAVAETHRRQGVATDLISRLQELAGERGAWVIFVQADYADPPAIALYEKLGVREEVLHFDIQPNQAR